MTVGTAEYSLWTPVFVPQMAGRGEPPVTMNWSKSHLWSVVSGCASTMSSISSLGGVGGGYQGLGLGLGWVRSEIWSEGSVLW